ncbi:ABC transporter permease [Chitinophaga sp. Cy-1792]|uniref:ABC transporter permease n=1 Tax=Chitinophaga sp. Cy-1792 TaxID=2608339 RepID=UPI00141EC4C0|nr:ABC transporter permease [Chitinophaga sp. Cy-1792]NIG55969.1 FtsX-like permease family protein [Chitinophaga sp. Cy-1792]
MFRNYFRVAIRNLWKNKEFSAINIFGLAIGLATSLLIIVYVLDELSYDRYNKHADNIYRIDGNINFGGSHFIVATAPAPMAATIKTDIPEVEEATRFRSYDGFLVKKGLQNIQEDHVIYADNNMFNVFSMPLLEGDSATALTEPRTVVLTEKTARKYFNATDVVGKTLIINDSIPYRITGVLKQLPTQSQLTFDFYVSLAGIAEGKEDNWLSNNFATYVRLHDGADPKVFIGKVQALADKHAGPQINTVLNTSLEELKKNGNYLNYELMPLTSIHLYSNKSFELNANGSIQYVYIFGAIALFILLIACINFMNLSTAKSANRAKEVGVRKVMGSQRTQLVAQFITESMLISAIAMLLALCVAALAMPFFNQLAGKEMNIGLLATPQIGLLLLLLVLFVGILAGSYPAFFLSGFRPVAVLKGTLAAGFKKSSFRNALVIGQFAISIFLIIGTIVIYGQLNYIRNKQLGFNRDQVLVIHNTNALGNQIRALRQELTGLEGVSGATTTGYLPTGTYRNDSPLFLSPTKDPKTAVSMQNWFVDDQYIPVLGMQMKMGRNFSSAYGSDSSGVIINEAAAKLLGLKDPVNTRIYGLDGMQYTDLAGYHVVGVVKDFNFNSLREQVTPVALFLGEQRGSIALRVHSNDMPKLLSMVEKKWQAFLPGQPFSYSFMDDDFNKIYQAETRMGVISLTFSILAVFVACLGLFGLAAYAAEQRTREIGIRKALGATVTNIVHLLSKDFLKLVMIALLIAFPLGWWAMHHWLQDFAYRTAIGWQVFAGTAVLSVLIALCTVSYQAIRAALTNPVKSLKS